MLLTMAIRWSQDICFCSNSKGILIRSPEVGFSLVIPSCNCLLRGISLANRMARQRFRSFRIRFVRIWVQTAHPHPTRILAALFSRSPSSGLKHCGCRLRPTGAEILFVGKRIRRTQNPVADYMERCWSGSSCPRPLNQCCKKRDTAVQLLFNHGWVREDFDMRSQNATSGVAR